MSISTKLKNLSKYLVITALAKIVFGKHEKTLQERVNHLITIYKAFVRPHLDYGDVLYDQAFNFSFHDRLESVQYNACLTITGAIRGMSKEKLYQELELESLRL